MTEEAKRQLVLTRYGIKVTDMANLVRSLRVPPHLLSHPRPAATWASPGACGLFFAPRLVVQAAQRRSRDGSLLLLPVGSRRLRTHYIPPLALNFP